MRPETSTAVQQKMLEDPLAYLPVSTIVEFRKGQTIYNQGQKFTSLYLVISGKVVISRVSQGGRKAPVEIYLPDEFFGESAFLYLPERSEQAVTLEDTKLMEWKAAEINDIIIRHPRLGVAIAQLLAQRTLDLTSRMESLMVDSRRCMLVRALLRFSERMGTRLPDGSEQMIPLTQELLAQFIGVTRENVTQFMGELRRHGFLNYSRKVASVTFSVGRIAFFRQNFVKFYPINS